MSQYRVRATGKAKAFLDELQAFADTQRSLIHAECDGFPPDPDAREARRARAMDDYGFFVRTYFPHYVKGEFSEFQAWFVEQVPKLMAGNGKKYNVSAPRGEAKSTLGTKLGTVWAIVTKRKRCIPIVMDVLQQAASMLESIKAELTDNPRLRMDFPEETGEGRTWNAGTIITPGDVKVEAFGALKRMRGASYGPYRPDFVWLDDIEDDEHVKSAEQRDKREQWVTNTVLPLGPPDGSMDVGYLNTLLHYDSVANRFHKKPGWVRRKFSAIIKWPHRLDLWQEWEAIYKASADNMDDGDVEDDDDANSPAQLFYEANKADMERGAVVSWPGVRPLLALMKIRAGSHKAFDCEYQNDPSNEANATFTEMQYWNGIVFTNDWVFKGVLDPSLGKSARKGDPCCILVGASRRDKLKLHIVEADLGRLKPKKQLEKLIAYQQVYSCLVWGVENTAFQEYFREQIVEQSAALFLPVPAIGIENDRDKDILIEAVAPHANNGLILFHQRHTLFNDNVKHYPEAAHDDGPDGLQMLWKLFQRGMGGIPKIRTGKRK